MADRRNRAPLAAIGAVILLDALAARLLLSADENHVYFLGRALNWVCAFREKFGLPCPTCGMTRSMVLALHGDFLTAWTVAPGGPVLLAGLVAIGCALLLAAFTRVRGAAILRGSAVYGSVAIAIWLGGWVSRL
jgi:hypothetical protein